MEVKAQGLPVSLTETPEKKIAAPLDNLTEDSTLNTVTPLEELKQIAAGFAVKKASCNRIIPLCLPGYEHPLEPSPNPLTKKNQLLRDLTGMQDSKLLLLFGGKPLSAECINELHKLKEAMDAHPSIKKIQLESQFDGIQVRLTQLTEKKQATPEDIAKKEGLLEQSAQLLKQIAEIEHMNFPSLDKFLETCIAEDRYIFKELKERLTPPDTNQQINSTQLIKLALEWHNQQIMSVSGVVLLPYAVMFDKDQDGMPVVQDSCITNLEASADRLIITAITEKFFYTLFTKNSTQKRSEILIDSTIAITFDITLKTESAWPTVHTNNIELVKHIFITFCEKRCRALEKEKTATKKPGDKKSRTSLMTTSSIPFFKSSSNLSKTEQLKVFLYTVYLKMLTTLPMEEDGIFMRHMEAMAKLPANDTSAVDRYLAAQYVKKHSKYILSILLRQYAIFASHNASIKVHSEAFAKILAELEKSAEKEIALLSEKFSAIQKQYDVITNELPTIAEISKIKQSNSKNSGIENFSVEELFTFYNHLNQCEETLGHAAKNIPLLANEIIQLYQESLAIRDGISESKSFVSFS